MEINRVGRAVEGLAANLLSGRRQAIATITAGMLIVFSLTGCDFSGGKNYNIGPIFPMSPNKCQKYNGKEDGRSCWVSLEDCKRAATDWSQLVKGQPNAIRFKC